MTAEERFAEIISDALGQADGVPCSLPEYIGHLKAWCDEIAVAVAAAEESIKEAG